MEPSSTQHEDKIYIVTHQELSTGYQTAQSAHAIAELLMAEPVIASKWHRDSNSIIVLAAKNAKELFFLNEQSISAGLSPVIFREPDLMDEITAIAFAPSALNKKFLRKLTLVGKNTLPADQLQSRETRIKSIAFPLMEIAVDEHTNALQYGRNLYSYLQAVIAHLRGEVDLNQYDNWNIPYMSVEEANHILNGLPSAYDLDRACSFFYSNKVQSMSHLTTADILSHVYQEETPLGAVELLSNSCSDPFAVDTCFAWVFKAIEFRSDLVAA